MGNIVGVPLYNKITLTFHDKNRKEISRSTNICFAGMDSWEGWKLPKTQYVNYIPATFQYPDDMCQKYWHFLKRCHLWHVPKILRGISFERYKREGVFVDIDKWTIFEIYTTFILLRYFAEHEYVVGDWLWYRSTGLNSFEAFRAAHAFPLQMVVHDGHSLISPYKCGVIEGIKPQDFKIPDWGGQSARQNQMYRYPPNMPNEWGVVQKVFGDPKGKFIDGGGYVLRFKTTSRQLQKAFPTKHERITKRANRDISPAFTGLPVISDI